MKVERIFIVFCFQCLYYNCCCYYYYYKSYEGFINKYDFKLIPYIFNDILNDMKKSNIG